MDYWIIGVCIGVGMDIVSASGTRWGNICISVICIMNIKVGP